MIHAKGLTCTLAGRERSPNGTLAAESAAGAEAEDEAGAEADEEAAMVPPNGADAAADTGSRRA